MSEILIANQAATIPKNQIEQLNRGNDCVKMSLIQSNIVMKASKETHRSSCHR